MAPQFWPVDPYNVEKISSHLIRLSLYDSISIYYNGEAMKIEETGNASVPADTDKLAVENPSTGTLHLRLSGEWRMAARPPSTARVDRLFEEHAELTQIVIDGQALRGWDSSLLIFLARLNRTASEKGIQVRSEGLPEGSQRLLERARSSAKQITLQAQPHKQDLLTSVGSRAVNLISSAGDAFEFIGEVFVAIVKLCQGKAAFRKVDLGLFLQQTGAQALPIVSLISALVGLILAFVGAVQLRTFGAQIYVADLVGIGMVRVMGAIMAGIIMAGRTGAAYAAQIGTMQVNEEVDALRTLGVSPVEFLVLPRVLALMIMMPLLTLYADIMGVLGGLVVGVLVLDINPVVYLNETTRALTLTTVWIGVFHGAVFGLLVGIFGCMRGMQCGRSASGVGYATTSAVVTSIIAIIVATAIITISCNILKI
jgi:phospholipid/cholesterol/gamma-HCH transport system permease protein